MILVEVACQHCGLVRIGIKKFSLYVDPSNGESFFTFVCPSCNSVNKYPADDYIVEVLTFNGVMPHIWERTLEMLEPKIGPPLTYDDLLDLHLELSDPNWFEKLKNAGKKDLR